MVLLGSYTEKIENLQLLENAKRYLQMQTPQVEAARRLLVEVKAKLASQGDDVSAEILGELLQRNSMRLG